MLRMGSARVMASRRTITKSSDKSLLKSSASRSAWSAWKSWLSNKVWKHKMDVCVGGKQEVCVSSLRVKLCVEVLVVQQSLENTQWEEGEGSRGLAC